MKVLITGGSGFIGRRVAQELVKNRLTVTVYDTHECEDEGVAFVRGDALDLENLRRAAKGAAAMVHLVGIADAHCAEENPDLSFRLNVVTLHNALEVCRLEKVQSLLFPSSASVYGRTDKIPVSEEDALRPTGIYAYHKWLCEELIRAYRATYGINYIIFRLFNTYGPGNNNIIHHCIRAGMTGKAIELFGADQVRDFVFVADIARAFRLAITKENLSNHTINLGTGKGWTIRGVVHLVKKEYPALEVIFKEKAGYVPFHSVADCTLARTLLGYKAEASEEKLRGAIREISGIL